MKQSNNSKFGVCISAILLKNNSHLEIKGYLDTIAEIHVHFVNQFEDKIVMARKS